MGWVRCSPGKKIAINCIFKEIWLNGSAIIVGKKRDHGILDPMIFSGKIRKNRINSEKYCVGEVFQKIWKNTKKTRKIRKNWEKYEFFFGKIKKNRKKLRRNRNIWKN